MLKKFAIYVLASKASSMVPGGYDSWLSSATALPDGLFEHSGVVFSCWDTCRNHRSSRVP